MIIRAWTLLNIIPNREWAVVVAKLAEWLLPIPEVCGSNPVMSKIL